MVPKFFELCFALSYVYVAFFQFLAHNSKHWGFFWTSEPIFVNSKRPIQFGILRLLCRWHLHSLLL